MQNVSGWLKSRSINPLLIVLFVALVLLNFTPAVRLSQVSGNSPFSAGFDLKSELQATQELAIKVPFLKQALKESYNQVQGERLEIYAWVLLVALPLTGFTGFLLFPALMRRSIQERLPRIPFLRIFRIYLLQALIVAVMLLALGATIWFSQFILSRIGHSANPQVMLENEEIQYVVKNSPTLTHLYPETFIPLAQNLDPHSNQALMAQLIESALQSREDGLIRVEVELVNFTWPSLSFVFAGSLVLMLFFFLQRLQPNLKAFLSHPIALLDSDVNGRPTTTLQLAARLVAVELRVVLLFIGLAIGLTFVMAAFLRLFLAHITGLLIELISGGMTYYLREHGNTLVVMLSTLLVLLFMVETVVLFSLSFAILMGRLSDIQRRRYQGKYGRQETRQINRAYRQRFYWLLFQATALSLGLSIVAGLSYGLMVQHSHTVGVPLLLGLPSLLLLGLNIGLWRFQGFRYLVQLNSDEIEKAVLVSLCEAEAEDNSKQVVELAS
ncbi:MAG TPA: hypothetical protein VH186_25620 [Chloroflexia bacterium]|nr:hypothetical protein [Chloroflexia bacterium]